MNNKFTMNEYDGLKFAKNNLKDCLGAYIKLTKELTERCGQDTFDFICKCIKDGFSAFEAKRAVREEISGKIITIEELREYAKSFNSFDYSNHIQAFFVHVPFVGGTGFFKLVRCYDKEDIKNAMELSL